MHPSVARLTAVLPTAAAAAAGDVIDWAVASERWGTGFPADYRDFVARYGAGSINDSFHIGLPLAISDGPLAPVDFAELTELGLAMIDEDADERAPVGARISWACDAGANHLFWNMADPNPDNWSVLRLTRHGEWTDFECGMADFMIRFLTGEIAPQPMALFNPERPVFTHWREEGRR
jgi:hypothetical protein